MKKRLLSKIEIEKASVEYVKMANTIKDNKYLVSAKEITVEENKILLVYFYHLPDIRNGSTQAVFRVFLTQEDYITQDLKDTTKWRTGSIKNILSSYWYWHKKCTLADEKSHNAIAKFLNTNENPLKSIDDLQELIMFNRLKKKHDVIKNRIDKQMEKVPEIPKDFENWVNDTVLYHSRYIYYEYKARKHKDGYCTHCKSDVIVEFPKHNKKGICPNCKSHIVYKATGKSKYVEDEGDATIIQKIDEGILIRYFKVRKGYYESYRSPVLYCNELVRIFYNNNDEQKSYEWSNFKQTGERRWCEFEGYYWKIHGCLYDFNLKETLDDTKWQYSAMKEFASQYPGYKFNIIRYLSEYIEYPFIEYLVKLRLYNLVEDIVFNYRNDSLNLQGKTFQEVIKLEKGYLPMIQRINASARDIKVLQLAGQYNLKLTDEQVKYWGSKLRATKDILDIAKHTTIGKIIKYIESQKSNYENTRYDGIESHIFIDWKDYINNCKQLEYDIKNKFVLFPKNLKKRHDETYKLIKENNKKLLNEEIERMSSELAQMFNWEWKKYMIMVPRNADEIIREGQELGHCVGSYLEKIVKGRCVVLFLRHKENPDKSYYTIEIANGEIKQCRGKGNEIMKKDVKLIEKIKEKFSQEKLSKLNIKEAV